MSDVVSNPTMQAGAGLLVLCILIAAGFYLLSRFRDYTAHDQENAADVLANLEEMHLRGDISDEEFRTIQASTERLTVDLNRQHDRASQADATSPS